MATKNLSAVITLGGTISGSLKNALGQTRTGFDQIGKAVTELKTRQKELNTVISQQEKLGASGSALRVQFANQELVTINKQIDALKKRQATENSAKAGMAAGKGQMASSGVAIGATVAAASMAFVPVVQAAAFEKAMLGVAKQVEGARDESGKLTQVYYDMAKQVQVLGGQLPIATNDIAEMVAAGARMGVAKENLIDFTRTSAMMASAFELPAGQLAEQMGKISGLYKIPIGNIGELADAINYLDDKTEAKAPGILDFLTRTGGVAGSVKVTGSQMAALGSTLLTLGDTAETASTATNAIFQKFASADKGTKKFKEAMQEIGISTAEVQKGMQVDAQGTLLKVMESVNKMPAEKRLGVLVDLVGLEHSDTLAKLAGNVDTYRKQIDLASSQEAKGSMGREFQATLQTTSAQFQVMKNQLTTASVNIGSVLLPAVNQAISVFGVAATAVGDFAREHPTLVGNITTVVGTLGGLFLAFKTVSFGIGAATFAFNALKLAMATNPIGLVLAGLTTAAMLIYKNWEPIKEFFAGLWQGVVTGATAAFDWVIGKLAMVGEYWGKIKAAFGFGGGNEAPASGAAASAGAPPSLPDPRVPGGAVTNNVTNAPTITIQQQPGQDSKALADEVIRRMKEKEAVQHRSRMHD